MKYFSKQGDTLPEYLNIRIFEVVGSGLCVAADDGQKVFDQIAASLKKGLKVQLSFMNVKNLTSAFLNSAIGQLYAKFSEDEIRDSIEVIDIEQEDVELLDRVIITAKKYFKNPKRFINARNDALGENSE